MIKPKQLKKLSVGQLKLVIQEYEIGKVSKKKKAELIETILNSEKAAQILDDIDPETLVRPKRNFSKKQLENQRKFAERARERKGKKKLTVKIPPTPKEMKNVVKIETEIKPKVSRRVNADKAIKKPKVVKKRISKTEKKKPNKELTMNDIVAMRNQRQAILDALSRQ